MKIIIESLQTTSCILILAFGSINVKCGKRCKMHQIFQNQYFFFLIFSYILMAYTKCTYQFINARYILNNKIRQFWFSQNSIIMSLGLPKIGMKISHFKFKIFKFAFNALQFKTFYVRTHAFLKSFLYLSLLHVVSVFLNLFVL